MLAPGERIESPDTGRLSARGGALLLLAMLAGLAGLAVLLQPARSSPVFPMDDAYITLHNAMSLRAGADVNYPGVPPLVGATSAPHVALTAGLMNFLPPAWALYFAAWLGAALYCAGLCRLMTVLRLPPLPASLLAVVGLTLGGVPHQLFNGLETGWAMAGVTWGLATAADPDPRRSRRAALVAGQLPFLRPELAVVSVLLLALLLRRRLREGGGLGAAAGDVGAALLSAAPWLAWITVSTGMPFPETAFAKRAFFAEGQAHSFEKWAWAATALAQFFASMGLATLGLVFLPGSGLGRIGLAFTGVLVLAYASQFPGALGHYENRYLYVTVPFLLYGLMLAVAPRIRTIRVMGVLLIAAAAIQALATLPAAVELHRQNCTFTTTELAGVAAWCQSHLPADSRLLVHDAGYIAYATRLKLVDLVGLKTPSSVARHRELTWPTGGRARGAAIARIALEQQGNFLCVLEGWERIYRIAAGLRDAGWRVVAVWRSRLGYTVYEIDPPGRASPLRLLPSPLVLLTSAADASRKSTGSRYEGGWMLWQNGTIAADFEVLVPGIHRVSVEASGTPLQGVYPRLILRLRGEDAAAWQVDGRSNVSYEWEGVLAAGRHSLVLGYENDDCSTGEDRNLFLGELAIRRLPATSPSGRH